MKRFSEFVSLGHPDKIADYISQYILDKYIEKDPLTRYAVEVQIKNHTVTLGGEISSNHSFAADEIANFVSEAVNEIGYTREYMEKWGAENTICGDTLEVTSLISQQSNDIAQGLNGWGDQGIFFGHCEYNPQGCGMPLDHAIAKRLCKELFDSNIGGLDIKTQIVMDGINVEKVIVAIPLEDEDLWRKKKVEAIVREVVDGDYTLIINGTGRYVLHASIADCGTTGRKLAVDFYGGNCKLGGGSPWTKDGSKADLTLNLVARSLAKEYASQYECDVTVALACCIGKQEVDYTVQDKHNNILDTGVLVLNPQELRHKMKLDTPIYASMCRWGLFGEFQQDKVWEQ